MTRMLFDEVTQSICQFRSEWHCRRCPDINDSLSQSVIDIIITIILRIVIKACAENINLEILRLGLQSKAETRESEL